MRKKCTYTNSDILLNIYKSIPTEYIKIDFIRHEGIPYYKVSIDNHTRIIDGTTVGVEIGGVFILPNVHILSLNNDIPIHKLLNTRSYIKWMYKGFGLLKSDFNYVKIGKRKLFFSCFNTKLQQEIMRHYVSELVKSIE